MDKKEITYVKQKGRGYAKEKEGWQEEDNEMKN